MISLAHAAELVPVSPPTDWIGIGIIAAIVFVIVALVGYIVHIKRTPGKQLGEEEIERIAHAIMNTPMRSPTLVGSIQVPAPIYFDGIKFDTHADLDRYKAAKEIVDSHRKEAT